MLVFLKVLLKFWFSSLSWPIKIWLLLFSSMSRSSCFSASELEAVLVLASSTFLRLTMTSFLSLMILLSSDSCS